MKKLLLVLFVLLSQYASIGQIGSVERIKSTCDSIFTKLKKETNADKKAELIISFYLTSIDGFLYYCMIWAKIINTWTREKGCND
jgi:pantothenate kinase